MSVVGERSVRRRILRLAEEASAPGKVCACCLYGSRAGGYARDDSDYDVLLVLEDYSEGVRYRYQGLLNVHAAFLTVDRELFELDVRRGGLGEFIAGRILTPYIPLSGSDYISGMEEELKRRVIIEEGRNLALTYGELARGIAIKPEFFIFSRMNRRMKVYPPLRYSYHHLFGDEIREVSLKSIMPGLYRALDRLEVEGIVERGGGYVFLTDKFIDGVLSKKYYARVVNILEASQRALHSYFTHGKAGRVSVEILAKELTSKLARGFTIDPKKSVFIDPKRHLYLKTSTGAVTMNEEKSVIDIITRVNPHRNPVIHPLGNALNEVFLVEGGGSRYVVKKYSDWYGFKWFFLNLAALGTKLFSVSGKARMSNEYGMTHHLIEHGIQAPEIIDLNLVERAVVKEFIDGKPVLNIVKEVLSGSEGPSERRRIFSLIGGFLANVHANDITLGDSKPENFIVTPEDNIVFLDLEQSRKGGDKAWDVAEFLYYTGHYGFTMNKGLKDVIRGFIEGYASAGDVGVLRKAASLNYIRVFSFWTPAQIIFSISSQLRSMGEEARGKG